MHYLVAYNSLVSRGLDTKLSSCGYCAKMDVSGPYALIEFG